MKFESREDRLKNNYRKVEAMYRKGCDTATIIRQTELDKFDVFDIIQKIFAMDERRKARAI